jgi:hypothetical protein
MRSITTLVLGLGAVAAAVGIGMWVAAPAKASAPSSSPLSTAQCTLVLQGMPTEASWGLMDAFGRAGVFDLDIADPAAKAKIGNIAATYFATHGYGNVANCVRATPEIIDAMPGPDCEAAFRAVPASHKDAVLTQLKAKGMTVPDTSAGIPTQELSRTTVEEAANALDSLGDHHAAICTRMKGNIFLSWINGQYDLTT